MNENIIVPHPLHPLLADRNRGRGVQTQITEKTLIRVFFVVFFATIFFTVQNGRTFSGGVQLFIYLFIFFFLGGGGSGGGKSLFNLYNKTYITCDFSGGGGVRTTYPSLDPRIGKK